MKLIKLGTAYLNMDLVTDVWVERGQVSLFFAVPTMYSRVPFRDESNATTTRELHFYGAQAAALIEWLDKRAKDITPARDQAENADVPGAADDSALTDYDYGTVDDAPNA